MSMLIDARVGRAFVDGVQVPGDAYPNPAWVTWLGRPNVVRGGARRGPAAASVGAPTRGHSSSPRRIQRISVPPSGPPA